MKNFIKLEDRTKVIKYETNEFMKDEIWKNYPLDKTEEHRERERERKVKDGEKLKTERKRN